MEFKSNVSSEEGPGLISIGKNRTTKSQDTVWT